MFKQINLLTSSDIKISYFSLNTSQYDGGYFIFIIFRQISVEKKYIIQPDIAHLYREVFS